MHIIKHSMAVLATVTMVLGLTAVVASPAQAANASPGCVTYREWKYKMHKGMTRAQVYAAVGTNGTVTSYSEYSDGEKDWDVDYRQCNRYGNPAASWHTTWLAFSNLTYDRNYNNVWHRPPIVTYKGIWMSV